jgi:hypothetical protein
VTLAPGLRKFTLTAHVTSSVGWLGAVAGFLALSIAALTGHDAQRARAAYLAMELVAWSVIVPLSIGSLLTGLLQALGTPWGLFQHYWVLVKLLMTVLATVVLLLHLKPIGWIAGIDAETILANPEVREVRFQLVVDAAAALIVLLVATALSVYKPRGMTRYGQRQRARDAISPSPAAAP